MEGDGGGEGEGRGMGEGEGRGPRASRGGEPRELGPHPPAPQGRAARGPREGRRAGGAEAEPGRRGLGTPRPRPQLAVRPLQPAGEAPRGARSSAAAAPAPHPRPSSPAARPREPGRGGGGRRAGPGALRAGAAGPAAPRRRPPPRAASRPRRPAPSPGPPRPRSRGAPPRPEAALRPALPSAPLGLRLLRAPAPRCRPPRLCLHAPVPPPPRPSPGRSPGSGSGRQVPRGPAPRPLRRVSAGSARAGPRGSGPGRGPRGVSAAGGLRRLMRGKRAECFVFKESGISGEKVLTRGQRRVKPFYNQRAERAAPRSAATSWGRGGRAARGGSRGTRGPAGGGARRGLVLQDPSRSICPRALETSPRGSVLPGSSVSIRNCNQRPGPRSAGRPLRFLPEAQWA